MNNYLPSALDGFNKTLIGFITQDDDRTSSALDTATKLIRNIGPETDVRSLAISLRELRIKAERNLHLLNGLFYWKNQQQVDLVDQNQPFLLRKVIEEVIAFHQPNANAKRVCIANKVPENQMVCAPYPMLLFINISLLGNALRFSPQGGVITISLVTDRELTTISYRDIGNGIPSTIRNSLFKGELIGIATRDGVMEPAWC